MNRLSPLNPHIAFQLAAMLALAAIVLVVWCAGWLYGRLRPRPSLVSIITESNFAAWFTQGREPGSGTRSSASQTLDRKVARTLFRYLREVQGVAVAPLPGDHLVWDLGLSEARIEQSLIDLARRLNRDVSQLPLRLPATVEEMAYLLSNLPATSARIANRAA